MNAKTYIVYHGSPKAESIKKEGFKRIYKRAKNGQRITYLGYHFTKHKENAKPYGNVITARINVKLIPESKYFKLYNKLIKEGYKQPHYNGKRLYGASFITEIKKQIRAKGYDGIDGEEVVVFDKRKIEIIGGK